MKKMIICILVIILLTAGLAFQSNARFWGWQVTDTTDWSDGNCTYREVYRVYYIFWVARYEECISTTIECS